VYRTDSKKVQPQTGPRSNFFHWSAWRKSARIRKINQEIFHHIAS
jgi:hypothetical protein